MGKVRKYRQKLHNAAVKFKKQEEAKKTSFCDSVTTPSQSQNLPPAACKDLFQNVTISPEQLQQSLKDFDMKSVTSQNTNATNNTISKKDKRKRKHQAFLEKLNACYTSTKKVKEAKKRAKTAVVGDLMPLLEALPTLESLLQDSLKQKNVQSEQANKKLANGGWMKNTEQRMKDTLSDIQRYQQVMAHPAYKMNPFSTISEHISNTLKAEQMLK